MSFPAACRVCGSVFEASPGVQACPRCNPRDEMECPRCAEKIKAKARVCRFCSHDFDAAERLAESERARLAYLASEEGQRAQNAKRLESSRTLDVAPRERVEESVPHFWRGFALAALLVVSPCLVLGVVLRLDWLRSALHALNVFAG